MTYCNLSYQYIVAENRNKTTFSELINYTNKSQCQIRYDLSIKSIVEPIWIGNNRNKRKIFKKKKSFQIYSSIIKIQYNPRAKIGNCVGKYKKEILQL
jgi:hypothetical protein